MNKNWLKYLVAIAAIMIAGSAAFFSVTGLGVLFSGAAVAVMIMAGSLEFAKLVTATYLKQEWDTIKGLSKWYLTSAVIILMLITSAGIFGYLSNAFQQQNLALQQVDRLVLIHTTKIQQNEAQIKQLSTQITESNTNQGKILDNGKVNSRLLRSIDNRDKQISNLNDKIALLQKQNAAENDSINKIKTDNIGIEKEVGGFRFVAEAFGVELKTVVKFFIILIVIVFDPLAVALIISFNQLVMIKKKDEEITSEPGDLKDFVDETSRLHLSENDLKIIEETLLNPPTPNNALKEAAKIFNEEIENNERMDIIGQNGNEGLHYDDDISDWDATLMDGLKDEKPAHILEKEKEQFHYWDIKSTPSETTIPEDVITNSLNDVQTETFSKEPTSLNEDEKKK